MPTIKSKEWLKKAKELRGWSTARLSQESGISAVMIAKILSGDRIGSADLWDSLESALDISEPTVSVNSDEIVAEIRSDITDFGYDEKCWIQYDYAGDNLIFVNYLLGDEPLSEDESGSADRSFRGTLLQALEFFDHQNQLFRYKK